MSESNKTINQSLLISLACGTEVRYSASFLNIKEAINLFNICTIKERLTSKMVDSSPCAIDLLDLVRYSVVNTYIGKNKKQCILESFNRSCTFEDIQKAEDFLENLSLKLEIKYDGDWISIGKSFIVSPKNISYLS